MLSLYLQESTEEAAVVRRSVDFDPHTHLKNVVRATESTTLSASSWLIGIVPAPAQTGYAGDLQRNALPSGAKSQLDTHSGDTASLVGCGNAQLGASDGTQRDAYDKAQLELAGDLEYSCEHYGKVMEAAMASSGASLFNL